MRITGRLGLMLVVATGFVAIEMITVVGVLVVSVAFIVLFVLTIMAVVVSMSGAHNLNPSPNTLASLDHTNSEPAVTFTPSGPNRPTYEVPSTVMKSNPDSTSYRAVLITNGRNAFTVHFSLRP